MGYLGQGRWAIALSLLFASGCQAPMQLHQLKQPWFAMGQADQPVPAAAASRPASAAGQLTVRFDGALARLSQGRRIQATVSDVEKVVVTVTSSSGAVVSETVLKAALNNGQTSVTFQGLTPGEATITITAYDGANANIGSTTKTATVTVGQVATVEVGLQLSPTYMASGGGSSSPSTGSLTTNVLIQDGPVVVSQPGGGVVESYVLPFTPNDVAVNSQGGVWVTSANSTGPILVKLSSGGAIERVSAFPGTSAEELVVGADDHVWVHGSAWVAEYSSTGDMLNQHAISGVWDNWAWEDLRMDETGRLFWHGPQLGLGTWAPGGSAALLPGMPSGATGYAGGSTVRPGTLDDLWVGVIPDTTTGGYSADVVRYARTGGEIGRYSVGTGYRSAYTAIDAAGNAWVTAMSADPTNNPKPGRVVKFSPTGTELAAYTLSDCPFANAIEIGPDGTVWVTGGDSSGQTAVTWLNPAGVEQGRVAVGTAYEWGFAIGTNGAWLVDMQTQSLVHVVP
jgi:hypothetical protein